MERDLFAPKPVSDNKKDPFDEPIEKPLLYQAQDKESQLKKAGVLREQLEAGEHGLSPEKYKELQERISQAETQVTEELVELYSRMREIKDPFYTYAREDVARSATAEKEAEQKREGRDYRSVMEACENAWNLLRVKILGTGATTAVGSLVMGVASKAMDADIDTSAMFAGGMVASIPITAAIYGIGYIRHRINQNKQTWAVIEEKNAARDKAWEDRGMKEL